MLVLVTRPEPHASRTAARLRQLGHKPLISPVLRIVPMVPERLFDAVPDAVIVTSVNALRAVEGHPDVERLKPLPLQAVGARTAEAARALGFKDVTAADGDVESLARLLLSTNPGQSLLHLAGRDRAGDLRALLGPAGPSVSVCEVYAAETVMGMKDEVFQSLAKERIGAVLHFSPRSAHMFMEQIRSRGLLLKGTGMRHLCLSANVAKPLISSGISQPVAVAAQPSEDALLALLDGSG